MSALYKLKNEKKLESRLAFKRQAYLLCYAYWYSLNIENRPIADHSHEPSLSVLLVQLKQMNFDIRKDLSLIRNGEKKFTSEKELKDLHHLISFPCNLSHFISDKKYAQLADEFVTWSEKIAQK